MGLAEPFEKEKLIMGIIYTTDEQYENIIKILEGMFGAIDFMTDEFSFSDEFSNYYDDEIGGEARRKILSFEELVDPSEQAEIKAYTNAVEAEYSVDGNRKINLDPGFLSHGRLMLATTKAAGFRIPLKNGIYTELTLFYARGGWHKFPWSYRDYQSERVQSFLSEVRKKYLKQRKSEKM